MQDVGVKNTTKAPGGTRATSTSRAIHVTCLGLFLGKPEKHPGDDQPFYCRFVESLGGSSYGVVPHLASLRFLILFIISLLILGGPHLLMTGSEL